MSNLAPLETPFLYVSGHLTCALSASLRFRHAESRRPYAHVSVVRVMRMQHSLVASVARHID